MNARAFGIAAALAAGAVAGAGVGDPLPADGLAALRAGDCNLCHAVPGVEPPARDASCTGCHVWIRGTSSDPAKRAAAMAAFPLWERYESSVSSYMAVPSLGAAMARLEPEWVETWLADPHDVRPGLPEGMPRFGLDAAQRAAIAGAFATWKAEVPATPKPSKKNVETGRARLVTLGCTACHGFGAAVPPSPGTPLAPDLAHTRARMSPDHTVAWIQDPRAVSTMATMPRFGVSEEDAIAIRDFLFLGDPAAEPPPPAPPAPPPTRDPVTWAQVEERVFGRICVHCHMDPENAANPGRRGPGNGGGFGWPETGIQLQTRDGVAAHAERVVAALLRRRDEARRDTIAPGQSPASLTRPEKPGMPLGLPPLSDEDLSLVLGWIEQGMPE